MEKILGIVILLTPVLITLGAMIMSFKEERKGHYLLISVVFAGIAAIIMTMAQQGLLAVVWWFAFGINLFSYIKFRRTQKLKDDI